MDQNLIDTQDLFCTQSLKSSRNSTSQAKSRLDYQSLNIRERVVGSQTRDSVGKRAYIKIAFTQHPARKYVDIYQKLSVHVKHTVSDIRARFAQRIDKLNSTVLR